MPIRDCDTCRYRDVDPKDDPCFSCQSVDAHRYRNWEQYREPIMRPAGQAPYLIKQTEPVAQNNVEVYRSMSITTLDGQDRSVSYLPMEDVYIIQGKRYAAGIFEALLRVGDTFKVVEGIADTVCLKMLHTCSPQKPDIFEATYEPAGEQA